MVKKKKKLKLHALGNTDQEEEVLALEAIYDGDFEHHEDGETARCMHTRRGSKQLEATDEVFGQKAAAGGHGGADIRRNDLLTPCCLNIDA